MSKNTTAPDEIFAAGFAEWRAESRPWVGYQHLMRVCESPIEKALGAALLFIEAPMDDGGPLTPDVCPADLLTISVERWVDTWRGGAPDEIALIPQAPIGPYRVDFLLIVKTPMAGVCLYVIECDGHDFHDRTKEQARKDRSRDRDLLRLGYKVIRFTGSEIYRDARKCAAEVERLLVDAEFPKIEAA